MKKYDIKDINTNLANRNICMLGAYKNTRTVMSFRCNVCLHEWSTTIRHVFLRKQNCPNCSNRYHDTNSVKDSLHKNDIELLSEYKNNKSIITVRCLLDGYVWKTCAYGLLRKKNPGKCPKCANKTPITNEKMDEILKEKKISRIENCKDSSKKPILFKCMVCANQWKTAPSNIISGTGCPLCKNKNEKYIHFLLTKRGIPFEYHKGIKIGSKRLVIDFILKNGIFIEYNGEQHYKPVRFGGMTEEKAKEMFIKQEKRDKMLRVHCLNSNIKLIEISYKDDIEAVLKHHCIL